MNFLSNVPLKFRFIARLLRSMTAPKRLSLLFGCAVALAFWIRVDAMPMAQTSPIDPIQQQQDNPQPANTPDPFATPTPDPFATPTVDPFATPTVDPFATPTPDPFATPTPDPFATPTPDPFATPTPDPFATPTPDPFATDVAATPVISPTLLLPLPPVDRAVVAPPAPEPLNVVGVLEGVLDGMADVAVWLWFVCGSLIFFVVAGVIGGLYFSQRERQRYDLYTLEPDEHAHFTFDEEPEQRRRSSDESGWPASLP